MVSNIENITTAERKMAKSSIELLAKYADKLNGNGSNSVEFPVGDSGEIAHIPVKVFDLLKTVLGDVAEGKDITVESHDKEIGIEEAAEILYFSDEHVEKLLNEGEIPCRKIGDKRLLKMSEVLKYQEKYKPIRRRHLEILVEEAQKLNLGY